MGIINRDLSSSEQKECWQEQFSSLVTGSTYVIALLPVNGLVTGVFATGFGLSNTPSVSYWLYRFNTGTNNGTTATGFTSIGIGATITVPAFGTSGFNWYGATLNGISVSNVLGVTSFQGDLLVAQVTGSNAAIQLAALGGIVKATDSILQWPG